MRTLLKYLIITIVLISSFIFYFFYTDSGQEKTNTILSLYASHKAGLDIKILKIDLHQFPYIEAEAIVEDLYHINMDGFIKGRHLDLRYQLNSECFRSDICRFDDTIQIKGTISGWRKNIHVTGGGKALDGEINYAFIRKKHTFKDVTLRLKDVNSSKLFDILDQEAIFHGNANAQLTFDTIEKKYRSGTIRYNVRDKDFYGTDVLFRTKIDIKDNNHTFTMKIISDNINIDLREGTYLLDKKRAHATYTLDIKDLSQLKKLLGGTYQGTFHASGELEHHKKLTVKGVSKDFGGELFFIYDSTNIELFLHNLAFDRVMHTIDTDPLLDANITGYGIYTVKTKKMLLETKLRNARLRSSSLTHTFHKKFGLNLENQVFDKSTLNLSYKDKRLSSHFKLANDEMHLKLTNTQLNASRNAIDTYIDLLTPKHALKGKLYARVDTIGEKSLDDIYIKFNGFIEKHYKLKLDGLLSDAYINMDYILSAARLPSHVCTIVDDINLSGHLSGSYKRLHIVGEGTAMEGAVKYNGIRFEDAYEDISVILKDIHTLKFFTLLGLPDFPNGKADVVADFSVFSEHKKKGFLQYTLKNGSYSHLPLILDANAKIKDNIVRFTSHATLSNASINITKGIYHLDSNISKALFTVATKNLYALKPLLGTFMGPFSAAGEIQYNKEFRVRGLSRSYDGIIDFLYKKNMLYIDLSDVSLKQFMRLFPYPPTLDALVNGSINYDYTQDKLLLQTDLNNTKFLSSDLVETVYDKSGVNMLKESFPHSTLRATYQNDIIVGDLMLQNDQSHFYFTSAKIDKNLNTIHAFFDLKMQGQAFAGKIYGDLNKPKIDLNMQKLIRYQMDKQLDSVIGESNRKLMEAMPMGGVAKDMATGVGGGFLDMFF